MLCDFHGSSILRFSESVNQVKRFPFTWKKPFTCVEFHVLSSGIVRDVQTVEHKKKFFFKYLKTIIWEQSEISTDQLQNLTILVNYPC